LKTSRKLTIGSAVFALLAANVAPAAAANEAFLFGESNLFNFYMHGSVFNDFKGFRTSVTGFNGGNSSIDWTATWFGCDTKPALRSTAPDPSSVTTVLSAADETAIDAALAADGCVALPSPGAKDSTKTAQGSFDAKYSFTEFDLSNKAFVTAKVSAAAAGKTTTFAILTGAARPKPIDEPTLSISGTTISVSLATFTADYRHLRHSTYLCDSPVAAQSDVSQFRYDQEIVDKNCVRVMNPTSTTELSSPSGHLFFVSNVDFTVYSWSSSSDVAATATATPVPIYTGPVLSSFSTRTLDPCASSTVTIQGSNLGGVTAASIQGRRAVVVESTDTRLVLDTPVGLTPGENQSLVLTSPFGVLTHQNAFNVSGSSVCSLDTGVGYWTQWQASDDTIKMYAKNPAGQGKVQFFVDGEEIAWVNASDDTDPKLRVITENGPMAGVNYLVRTVSLNPGKNRFEIRVDGERVWRATYLPQR
jgi:hypothetical protein